MTHYYDYYNHKINSPDSENPFKEPPAKFEPSQAGKRNQEQLSSIPDVFSDNICYVKAKAVSVEIIFICKELMQRKDYTILSPICNQIVRSATSINANVAEGSTSCISSKDRQNKTWQPHRRVFSFVDSEVRLVLIQISDMMLTKLLLLSV